MPAILRSDLYDKISDLGELLRLSHRTVAGRRQLRGDRPVRIALVMKGSKPAPIVVPDPLRRRLVAAGLAGLGGLPLARAQAPATRPPRVLTDYPDGLADLRADWAKEGFVEGRNIRVEALNFRAIPRNLLEQRMAEVVATNPDVIFMTFGEPTVVLQRLTRRIPIVFHNCQYDPVKLGIIQSVARPGGNLTGTYHDYSTLLLKRWSLYKEVMPSLKRGACLTNASQVEPPPWKDRDAAMAYARKCLWREREINAIAERQFGMRITEIVVPDGATEEQAIASVRRENPQAIRLNFDCAEDGPLERFLASERILSDLLVRSGSNPVEAFAHAIGMVPRILRGESPATIPAYQGTQYFVSLDMRMARKMRIDVPESVQLQAERIYN
jgi:putative ABC transport system substrate-binding protein